nr:hypothetical protein CFP56_37928 [Quercus suber]
MGALKCSLWDETCWILHLYQALSERKMLSSFPDNLMLALIKEFQMLSGLLSVFHCNAWFLISAATTATHIIRKTLKEM